MKKKNTQGMNVRCIVVCTGSSACPEFVPVIVNLPEGDYLLGHHYHIASAQAERQKYEGPFIVIDQGEPVDKQLREKLFGHFDWSKVEVQRLLPQCGSQSKQGNN